jgi:hypothetical protein
MDTKEEEEEHKNFCIERMIPDFTFFPLLTQAFYSSSFPLSPSSECMRL